MTYDGTNRKHIRAAEKQAKIREAARKNFIKAIMSQYDGRAWMHDLLSQCHVFHTSFSAGAPDITAFRLGEQNIGLQLFASVVSDCPTEYVLMMQEANAKEALDDRRYSDGPSSDPAIATGRGENSGRDDQGHEPDAGPEGDSGGWYN